MVDACGAVRHFSRPPRLTVGEFPIATPDVGSAAMAALAGIRQHGQTAATIDSPPTVATARAAAEAIAETVPGVQRIGLFGSLARGEATVGSDIDLLVVFHDMDYQDRKRLAGHCRSAARCAGHEVSVVTTDAYEWDLRSGLATTLERAIAADLQSLYVSDDPTTVVCREKGTQMDKPTSDLGEAYNRIEEAGRAYMDAVDKYLPNEEERELQRYDPDDMLTWYQYERYLGIVKNIDLVLEISLKALHHALGETPPPQSHRLHVLLSSLPNTPEANQAKEVLSPLMIKNLPPHVYQDEDLNEVYTNWRVHGTYDAPGIASGYLPTSRLEAYLDAADGLTSIMLDVMAAKSPDGKLINSREVTRHLQYFHKMRHLREQYELETGAQKRV